MPCCHWGQILLHSCQDDHSLLVTSAAAEIDHPGMSAAAELASVKAKPMCPGAVAAIAAKSGGGNGQEGGF